MIIQGYGKCAPKNVSPASLRIAKNSVTYRYTRFLNDRLEACENLCDSTKTSDVWPTILPGSPGDRITCTDRVQDAR